ncbi:hypothetical protein GCM10010503_62790 [Streptomyces lucensis JCM 4490]|uniref:Uncharacterized protein n=1 Tax=Streptomyces lucensis JCM 4490 TaxID=1306176 RepID=A0A918MVL8_9ACTN|nr:hypothetical protein [Streptomyces lucensis]GGW76438.1 hypothetical protein GCM10010503_62790 [Streptomyces lucensis JCM 4490]
MDGPAGAHGAHGHGAGRLASTPAEKRAAARALHDHIEPDTRRAGEWADDETGKAVKAFGARDGHGWLTATALRKAHGTWGDQVRNLMDRLGAEKDALHRTNTVLTSSDLAVGSELRRTSALDRY